MSSAPRAARCSAARLSTRGDRARFAAALGEAVFSGRPDIRGLIEYCQPLLSRTIPFFAPTAGKNRRARGEDPRKRVVSAPFSYRWAHVSREAVKGGQVLLPDSGFLFRCSLPVSDP